MRLLSIPLGFSALLGLLQSAYAQNVCQSVLQYAAHNYTLDIQDSSAAKHVYEQACSGIQTKDLNNLDVGLDAIASSIPIKFSLSNGSSKEKIESFCKTFDSDLKANSQKYIEENLVSPDAVKAWSDCVRLYGEGVSFDPIITSSHVVVQITKSSANPVDIIGVQFDKQKLSCTVPNDDSHSYTVSASINTRKHLVDEGTWPVSCDRTGSTGPDQQNFPQTDLIVLTNRDAFALPIPADGLIGEQSAKALNEQIGKLQSQIQLLSARKPSVECHVNAASSIKQHGPHAVARIRAEDGNGWTVTGGGCETHFDGGHWPPISFSGPDGSDGWACQGNDPPNIYLEFSVAAQVIYCRNFMK